MTIRQLDNEKELLLASAQGSQEAFAELFRAYQLGLAQYLHRFTQSAAETQDIVQDVFIRIWLQRTELAQVNNFSGWLFTLCRNHALNILKKRLRTTERERSWAQQFEGEIQAAPLSEGDQYRILLERAVDRLPPQQQKAYRLHRQERLTYVQIAEKLGIAPSTVKRNLEDAVKNLKKQLGGRIDPIIILILLEPWVK